MKLLLSSPHMGGNEQKYIKEAFETNWLAPLGPNVDAFEDAVAKTDILNGDFGVVSDGKFSTGANAVKAVMNIEVGDDADLDVYPIAKGTHVRVVDLTAFDGETIEIYGAQLPDTYAKGNKLVSDATGKLVTGGSVAPYFEITKVIPNVKGVEVKVVAK